MPFLFPRHAHHVRFPHRWTTVRARAPLLLSLLSYPRARPTCLCFFFFFQSFFPPVFFLKFAKARFGEGRGVVRGD